jgi:Sulfotransferase family
MGYTRSGSTLLDTLLGSVPGFFSAGELHYLWERGLIERRRCGCGRPLTECPVWEAVLRTGFPHYPPEPATVMRLQRQCARTRWTPRVLRAEHGGLRNWPALEAYVGVAAALYRGISSVTGSTVIVDSSKRPVDAAITRLVPGVEPYVVQLVRDPRAVAHSWSRSKPELDRGLHEEMPRQPVLKSAIGWAELNAMSEVVRRRFGSRSLLLKYEDLVRDVPGSVRRVLDLLGERDANETRTDRDRAEVRSNHTVSGNPSRFASGRIEVRADEEWVASMASSRHAAATAITLPLLLRYGYPVGRPTTGDRQPTDRS